VRTFNYLSIMHPTAHNLHFPLSPSAGEAARRHASPQPEEDAWGHGVFLLLSQVSRVLVISDPLYPLLEQNIGRSVFAMWRIKAAFDEGFRMLSAKFSPHGTAPTLLARIIQKMQQHHRRAPPSAAVGLPQQQVTSAAVQQQDPDGNSSSSSGTSTPRTGASSSSSAPPLVASPAFGGAAMLSPPPPPSSPAPAPGAAAATTATQPVRGLFHITLPRFFARPPADKVLGAEAAPATQPPTDA